MTGFDGVSVVIPTQAGPHLERAVESALRQRDVELEVIVVLNRARRDVEFEDPRVRILRSPREDGANGARSAGISTARHSFVALLDDDDEWMPHKLGRQLERMLDLRAQEPGREWIVGGRIVEIRRDGSTETIPRKFTGEVMDVETYLFSRRGVRPDRPQLQTSSLLFSRELARRVPFDPARKYHQDWTWLLDAADSGARAYVLDEAVCWRYVQGEDSVGGRITWRQSLAWAEEKLEKPWVRADFALSMASAKAVRRNDLGGTIRCMGWALRQGRPGVVAIGMWASALSKVTVGTLRGRFSKPARYDSVGGDPRREVFVRATGQAHNLGDSVLRRPLLDTFRPIGRLHVLVRSLPERYVLGLQLRPEDVVYADEREWLAASARQEENRETYFVFNAGEIQLNRYYAMLYLRYLRGVKAAVRSGGYGAHLGVGLRNPRSIWRLPVGFALRACRLVTWRDGDSAGSVGLGSVMPDWGFLEGSSDEWLVDALRGPTRNTLAITMRGDRPYPSARWMEQVKLIADRERLEMVLYAQVESDEERVRALAAQLGARHYPVDHSAPHPAQERTVRLLLQRASLIVSDRLHALIMGATEGAVPLGLVDGGSEKVARHFAAAGFVAVVHDPGSGSVIAPIAEIEMRRGRVVELVLEARKAIRSVRDDAINLAVGSRSGALQWQKP